MCGCPARLCVVSIGLPMDEISSLQSKEDIECILNLKDDEKVKENELCTIDLKLGKIKNIII